MFGGKTGSWPDLAFIPVRDSHGQTGCNGQTLSWFKHNIGINSRR
jgi:hypothetical protein